MKTNKILPMFAIFAIVGLLGTAIVAANGGWGNPVPLEDRDAIQSAVENKDFEAWRFLMTAQFTEERFNEIVARHEEMQEKRAAIESAIKAEDYGAWVAAMSLDDKEHGRIQQITEENFPTFVKLHKAQQAGDIEQIKLLSEELGFPQMPGSCSGNCPMHGKEMHNF